MEGADRATPVARRLQDIAQRVAGERLDIRRRLAGIPAPVEVADRLVGRGIDAEGAYGIVAARTLDRLAAVDDDEAEAQDRPVAVFDHGDAGRKRLLPVKG